MTFDFENNQTEEINNKKEIIKFEEPQELKEMKKEAREKAREIVNKIAKYNSEVIGSDLKIKEEEVGTEKNIEKKKKDTEDYLGLLNSVLNVINEYENNKKENPEFIEKQKLLAVNNLNEINKNEENKRFNDLISKITLDKLNNFTGRELEQLNNILAKIKDNKLLDSKEIALLKDFSEREKQKEKEELEKSEIEKSEIKQEQEYEDEKKEKENLIEETKLENEEKKEVDQENSKDNKNFEAQEDYLKNETSKDKSEQDLPNLRKEILEGENKGIEDLETRVLSLEQAQEQILKTKKEYLTRYQEYESKRLALNKEKNEKKKDELKKELEILKVYLDNAEKLYKNSLEEYKVAYYFEQYKKKKEYLFNEIFKNKGDILKEKIKKDNPNLSEEEINDLIIKEINQEVEAIIKNEKRELDKQIIGALAYDVLAKEEELANEKLEILRKEKEKISNWLSKIWDKYKNLSFSKRVLLGAFISGMTAGGAAVLAGAGFAALGIGSIAALRRLVSGFVVGGSIKGLSEVAITKKEKKEVESLKDKRVKEIQEDIVNLLNNSENELKKYEDYIKVMEAMDNRIDETIKEAEAIRSRNDKSRKKWTLLAVGFGGLAANADNIYALFKGVLGPESGDIVKEGVRVSDLTPPIEKSVSAPIGKGGFWEAALNLKKQLGLSAEDFEKAWSNSKVIDPVDGKEYLMPKAHFIKALEPNQDMFLQFDAKEKVFKAVLGPKVDVGGARELINAYISQGKKIPTFVIESLKKAGDAI